MDCDVLRDDQWERLKEFVPGCFKHRLVVEIDGPSHEAQEQNLADQNRDVWLREQGFRVLRLQNELVIASTELAVARIRDALTK